MTQKQKEGKRDKGEVGVTSKGREGEGTPGMEKLLATITTRYYTRDQWIPRLRTNKHTAKQQPSLRSK